MVQWLRHEAEMVRSRKEALGGGDTSGLLCMIGVTGAGRTEAFDARGSMGDGRTAGK